MKTSKKPFVVTLPQPSSPEREEPLEPVLAPHDHDVLCGRGGLTNHHLGNAWYRQLVRSNRELYRTSQKHTKLLIAKAIVNHVQEQDPPGRFLETDKKTGLWMPVAFNKAVNKTSQALREKDRENEGAIDSKLLLKMEECSEEEEKTEQEVSVEDEKLEKSDDLQPIDLNSSTSWFWRKNKKAKVEELEDPEDPEDLGDPLPLPAEPITKRASSIFRFILESKFMDGKTSSKVVIDEPLNDSQNSIRGNDQVQNRKHRLQPLPPAEFQQLKEPRSTQESTFVSMNPSRAKRVTIVSGNGTPQASSGCQQDSHSNQFRPGSTRAREIDEVEEPIFTRLKSQVSDWLQSFFPVSEDLQRYYQQMNSAKGLGQSNAISENESQIERQSHQQHHMRILDQLGQRNHHVMQQESGQVTQSQRQQSPMNNNPIRQHLMMMEQSIYNLEHQIVSNQNGKSILTLRQLQQQMQELSRNILNQRMESPSHHPIGSSTRLHHLPPSRPYLVQNDPYSDIGMDDMHRSDKRGGPGINGFEFQPRGSVVESSRTEQNHNGLMMPPLSTGLGSVEEGVRKRESPPSHTIGGGTYGPAFGLRVSGSLLMEDED